MKTDFVTSLDGTQISCVTGGSGPPLIYAHGASVDKFANAELQGLLRTKYTVTAYDRRGRGESGDHSDYNFLKEADDLRAVVQVAGGRPIVFGVSMGARIALESLRNPPDLAQLVLFEAPATDHQEPAFQQNLNDVRAELEAAGNEAGVVLHSRLFHHRSDKDIESLRRDKARWALRVDSFPITLREMEAVHRDCMFDPQAYAAPDFPVHLLSGDSTLEFLQASADMISKVPFVALRTLPGGDHSFPSTHPTQIYDALEDIVSKEGA